MKIAAIKTHNFPTNFPSFDSKSVHNFQVKFLSRESRPIILHVFYNRYESIIFFWYHSISITRHILYNSTLSIFFRPWKKTNQEKNINKSRLKYFTHTKSEKRNKFLSDNLIYLSISIILYSFKSLFDSILDFELTWCFCDEENWKKSLISSLRNLKWEHEMQGKTIFLTRFSLSSDNMEMEEEARKHP